jgi:hypothetical protein
VALLATVIETIATEIFTVILMTLLVVEIIVTEKWAQCFWDGKAAFVTRRKDIRLPQVCQYSSSRGFVVTLS